MRQHQFAGHIADGPDARNVGLHLFIDLDKAAFADLDADFFQSKSFGIGTEADRDQGLVRFEGFVSPSADTVTFTPVSVASTDSTLCPTSTLMPRFLNAFSSSALTSSSSSGTMRGSISTMVTSTP